MPILRQADPQTALQQGDLLDDVVTATTDAKGDTNCSPAGLVLVVSRNCQALRAKTVTVARVHKRPLQGLKEQAESLEQVIEFLKQLRDGDGQPDTFYLGELESNSTDRYVAKFDQLFTIEIPDRADERREYLKKHRRFRLDEAFSHDLHQRIFRAFASMGFDDAQWYPDADLKLILELGRSQRATLQARLQAAQSELALVKTSGGSKKDERSIDADRETTRKSLEKLEKVLLPIEEEEARRLALRSA